MVGEQKAAAPTPLTNVHARSSDDVRPHRMVMQRQMTGFGMRVETALDGETALKMARGFRHGGRSVPRVMLTWTRTRPACPARHRLTCAPSGR